MPTGNRTVVDIEVYPNFFVGVFRDVKDDTITELYLTDRDKIKQKLNECTLIGFNCLNYDIPILYKISNSTLLTHEAIYKESMRIIKGNVKHWTHDIPSSFRIIDLTEPAPGVMISLKLYGGRMHVPKMQDLPLPPDTHLTTEQMELITKYCHNDVDVTMRLYKRLIPQLKLRNKMGAKYHTDLMSKSDAQVAEAVIKDQLKEVHKPDIDSNMTWRYDPPEWCTNGDIIGDTEFKLSAKRAVVLPKELSNKKIVIGASTYKLGIGGLHSTESCVSHISTDDIVVRDFDVASYYPSIILGQGLYPEHLGNKFLDVYRTIVEQRLEAKHNGDKVTADSLKITINGSFGKFGSQYSFLFAPKLLTQTTITGQLALLMLIAELERHGIAVVSANTDGIVVKHHKDKTANCDLYVQAWEETTGFVMEETRYDALYSRDVNNYLAVKGDTVKGKGVFAPSGLMKNPSNEICYDAIKANALHNYPITSYILNCQDLTKFLTVRTVKGGAQKDGELLGKVVRWYYSTETDTPINYVSNGNKVAGSDQGMPVMDLPETLPSDINYDWYIEETYKIMKACVYEEKHW